jgi:hypothetical protein
MPKLNPVQLQKNLNQVNYPFSKKAWLSMLKKMVCGNQHEQERLIKSIPLPIYEGSTPVETG